MTQAKTAAEAKRRGHATYYTGKGCRAGHDAPRWAISRTCIECMPMDRSPEYVQKMRAAFDAAYYRTLKTGYLHVPVGRDDGWWIVPVRDPVVPGPDQAEGIKGYRLDG